MSVQSASNFDALSEEAVRRFLQTALVVDDRAVTDEAPAEEDTAGEELVAIVDPESFSEEELPPRPDDLQDGSQDASVSGASAEHGSAEDSNPDEDEDEDEVALAASQINVKVVADAFADEGLTCGVLKPEGEANTVDRIVGAGARADIVVIDWRLSDESGKTAADAVRELVAKSATGKRLIAIYTTQRNLARIAVKLCRELGIDESEEPVIDAQGARIEILNKVGVTPDQRFKDRQVPEPELPRYLVGRFENLVRGLVPVVALNALAATRENTHRLLERLGPGLDVGYAGHLLRLEHHEDAEQHLLDAVGDELQVIVSDDAAARTAAGPEGVLAWIREHESAGRLATSAADFEAHLDPGIEKPLKSTTTRRPREYSKLLVPDSETASAELSDARFAMLVSLTHHYQRPRPMLTLGAIVRETGDNDWYWLCVQPVCDAVRLKSPTLFPMLRLERVDPRKHGFQIVVPEPAGGAEPVYLWAASKPRDLHLIRIAPNDQEAVRFQRAEDGRLLPVETEDESFDLEWVAQLKPVNAQRVAEGLGGEFTRVGLDESEWLRLRAKDKPPPETNRERGAASAIEEGGEGVGPDDDGDAQSTPAKKSTGRGRVGASGQAKKEETSAKRTRSGPKKAGRKNDDQPVEKRGPRQSL